MGSKEKDVFLGRSRLGIHGSKSDYLSIDTIMHGPCGRVLKEETEIKKENLGTSVTKIQAQRVCQHYVSRRVEW